MLARELRTSLRGFHVWFDVDMKDKSEAAMQEAVENSMIVLAVITGDGPNDDNAYFNRPFCVKELHGGAIASRQAARSPAADRALDDKKRIGEFIGMAPDDLKRIGSIDFIDLNPTRQHFLGAHMSRSYRLASVAQLLRARREEAAVWESAPPGGYTAALRDAVRRIVDVDGGAQPDSAHSADSQTRSAGRSRVQTPN